MPVENEMEQRTGEQGGKHPEPMRPVFSHEEKSEDRKEGDENEPLFIGMLPMYRRTIDACTPSYT